MSHEINFIGGVQKVSDGRDSKNSWVDVTFRIPIAPNRIDQTNEANIRNAFRNRHVISAAMVIVDEGLFPKDPPPKDENQEELI